MRTLTFSQTPPIGGLNTRDDIGQMAPTDAEVLENFYPDTTAVDMRRGCTFYASVSVAADFETLVEFATPSLTAISCRCRGSAQEDELRVDINLSHLGCRIHLVQSGVTAKE